MADEPDIAAGAPAQGPANDPAAIGLALGAASAEAREYLRKQGVLADKQSRIADLTIDTLEKKDEFELSHLRFRRFSDYARFALELAGFLVVLLVVCGLGSMVWNASRERRLVVDAFSVPPDLAQTGMTGSVVANRLIDKLGQLQAASFSVIQGGESYRRDAGGGARVEIPDTGISLEELQRYLRDWLGHETHATGEVVHTAKGWSLTVRYGDEPGATLDGTDLDALIGQGAERLMAQALPYRYAEYLSRHGRFAEALALLPSLAPRGSAVERGRAYSAWATVYFYQGDMRSAAQKAQQGLDADPDNPTLYAYLSSAASNLSQEEVGWSAGAGVSSHMRGEVMDSLDPAVAAVLPTLFGTYHAELAGDYAAAVAGWARMLRMGTNAYDRGSHAGDTAALHDLAAARAIAAAIPVKDRSGKPNYQVPFERMIFAYYSGDWAGAARAGADTDAVLQTQPTQYWERMIFVRPLWAETMARGGDVAGAEALIAKTPLDCDDCVRKRGRIAALQHDWAAAARWFATVSARSPHIPFADSDWGEMLLRKGDLGGAIARFADANRKGPHFADPLEMWGEALIAQNRSDLALAKFAEAARYAPNWGRLHLKWGEALLWSGDKAGAQAQFAVARTLELSAADRATLARLTAAHV
jgi:tetratricopeptide (TPR) repeat protein